MSRNTNAWKFKHSLLQNEETCQAKYLLNVKFLEGLSSDKTKESKGLVVSYFVIQCRHMQAGNRSVVGSSPGWVICIVFLGKTFNSHNASLHTRV